MRERGVWCEGEVVCGVRGEGGVWCEGEVVCGVRERWCVV